MDELIVFWRARLDEDEQRARCRKQEPAQYAGFEMDPDQVLRQVEAGRTILARYGVPTNIGLGEHLQRSQEQQGLHFAIRELAAVYDDHPDYRPEWKL